MARIQAVKADDLVERHRGDQGRIKAAEVEDAVVAAALAEAKAQRRAAQEAVWANADKARHG